MLLFTPLKVLLLYQRATLDELDAENQVEGTKVFE